VVDRSPSAEEREATVGTLGARSGCQTVVDDNDDIEGGAMVGCVTVTEDDAANGRAMPFDCVGAAGEGEGGCGGRASLCCTAVFEEVEAERSILLEVFLAATVRAASLSVLLQEEHVLRGDHSPCLSLP